MTRKLFLVAALLAPSPALAQGPCRAAVALAAAKFLVLKGHVEKSADHHVSDYDLENADLAWERAWEACKDVEPK